MKKIFVMLGILITLLAFNGCTNSSNQETSETTLETLSTDNFLLKANTIPDEYADLFHTWYSANDIIAFTSEGEFFLTYDNIEYCIMGTYSIEDDIINVTIDPSTIKDSNIVVSENTAYKFEFSHGNLILTLPDDETQSITYYLDKSVALGDSN